jgi:hypothetical protein
MQSSMLVRTFVREMSKWNEYRPKFDQGTKATAAYRAGQGQPQSR